MQYPINIQILLHKNVYLNINNQINRTHIQTIILQPLPHLPTLARNLCSYLE